MLTSVNHLSKFRHLKTKSPLIGNCSYEEACKEEACDEEACEEEA